MFLNAINVSSKLMSIINFNIYFFQAEMNKTRIDEANQRANKLIK